MKVRSSIKWFVAATVAPVLLTTSSHAVWVLAGITDGDLSGGNPKSIILQAAAPVADNSLWGVGSANNGGASPGVEFQLPAGSAAQGDVIVIAGNTASGDFFANNFVQNFTLYVNGAANINGDDAIELFNNGSVFDEYGVVGVNGDGETWDYTDGFATRTGTGVAPFDQANWSSNFRAFDGLNEQQHIDVFVAAGFTQIPEPSSSLFVGLGLAGLLLRRRR